MYAITGRDAVRRDPALVADSSGLNLIAMRMVIVDACTTDQGDAPAEEPVGDNERGWRRESDGRSKAAKRPKVAATWSLSPTGLLSALAADDLAIHPRTARADLVARCAAAANLAAWRNGQRTNRVD